MRERRGAAWLLVLTLAACGGGKASVLEISSTGTHALAVTLDEATGRRDGYKISASYDFLGDGPTRLHLDVELHVDPQPVLDGGRWTYEGPTGRAAGTVVPRSLRFAGGQSDGVSLGGVFLLREDEVNRFEVHVPLTNLQPPSFR